MAAKIIIGELNAVKSDLFVIDMIAAGHFDSEGYTVTVIDGVRYVIPKTQGVDNFEAKPIPSWDTIKEHDGKYWIYSPANNPAFSEYRSRAGSYTWQAQEIEKYWEDPSEEEVVDDEGV